MSDKFPPTPSYELYFSKDGKIEIKNSEWTQEETEIGAKYIEYYIRPVIDIYKDKNPAPNLFVTSTEDIEYIHRSEKWWRTRKDEDEEKRVYPAGTRFKVVMFSRFGDMGFTSDLKADSGYTFRDYPFTKSFKDASSEP